MRKLTGCASRYFSPIMGEITFEERPFYKRSQAIFVAPHLGWNALGYRGCITNGPKGRFFHPDHVYDVSHIEQLNDGDIVYLESDGSISVLWESASPQNSLCLTESCNCHCIMCPQPPKPHNPNLFRQAEAILDLLRGKQVASLCLTGGEPTLLGKKFIDFLNRCVAEHPEAVVSVLTNGRLFSDLEFSRRVSAVASKNVLFCVSLHSEIDTIHDEITGKKGSYSDTQQGIYNLASCGCHVEIRHVISKLNYRRLRSFAEHIYGYFPFCSHYALMGLELYGCAAENYENVAISPFEYRESLGSAVHCMHSRGLPVSIYNIPLCMCEPNTRQFARKSISSWKNIYLPLCEQCRKKIDCSGFFGTSVSLPFEHITPLEKED